jgi:Secretion system C-terminal sorting domain
MKKYIFAFLFLFFSNGGFSQPSVRFKQFYTLSPFASESYDVTTTDSGYVVSGITVDTSAGGFSYNQLTLMGVDTLGNQSWVKKYGTPAFQYAHNFSTKWTVKKGNYIYLTCPVLKPGSITTSVLIKFDMNGDTIWQKEYVGIEKWIVTQGISSTPDSGFVLTGWIADTTNTSMLLLKTDSLGNEVWRQKINTNTFGVYGRSVVYDTITNKYVIAGMHSPPPSFDTKSLIIVTDNLGNKLNQYGFSGTFGGGLVSILISYDNNFIACGDNSTGIPVGAFEKMKRQVVKFNISGGIIWSKEFGDPSILNGVCVIKELPDNNLIVVGQYDTLQNAGIGLHSKFLIQKCDSNGDSIWARTIELVSGTANQDVFNSMDIANDGGYVLTGFFVGAPSPQKFCLVKLDSLGCDSLGCQFVGIAENTLSKIGLKVYPNPSNGLMQVDYKIAENAKAELIIYDLTGRMLSSYQMDGGTNSLQIDEDKLDNGIYFYQVIINNEIIESNKIVIVK